MLTEHECKYRNAFALTLLASTFTIYSVSSTTWVVKLIPHPSLASRKRENTLTPTKCEKYLLNLRHSIVIHNEYLFIWNCNCHISPSFAVSVLMFIHLPSFYCNLDTLSPGGSRVLWSCSFHSKVSTSFLFRAWSSNSQRFNNLFM